MPVLATYEGDKSALERKSLGRLLMLDVVCPNGDVVSASARQVFGRADVAADSNVSREQFRVTPVDGVDDVLQLCVLGRNGMMLPTLVKTSDQ